MDVFRWGDARRCSSLRGMRIAFTTVLFGTYLAATAAAAEPVTRVTACAQPPQIDGELQDLCWQSATWSSDFAQREPIEGNAPQESTRFAIGVDRRMLYVAVHAAQTGQITSYLSRRDTQTPSDWITVRIGSQGDRRSGASFSVNPVGVRVDRKHFDDTGEDVTWDAVWSVATKRTSDGWTAEFRIPLSQLAVNEDATRWDLQVERSVADRHEVVQWSLVPREGAGNVSSWGSLEGVDNVQAPRRLELVPYGLLGAGVTRDQGETFEPIEPIYGLGGDVLYGLTPFATLTGTINPDFGQVEADPAEINLSAFETRFTERRPFFVDTKNDFAIDGPEFYYSRRIGRPPQLVPSTTDAETADLPDRATVLGAATIRVRRGDTSFALLDAATAQMTAVINGPDGERKEVVEPFTNRIIGRAEREFREGASSVGVLFTHTSRELDAHPELAKLLHEQAYSGALDFDHRWRRNEWRLSAMMGFSDVSGTPQAIARTQRSSARYFQRPQSPHLRFDESRRSMDGWAGKLRFARESGAVIGSASVDARSPGLELNDTGFLTSTDRIAASANLAFRDLAPGKLFRSWSVGPNVGADWTFGGERTGLSFGASGNVQWLNYWSTSVSVSHSRPEWCTNCTRGGPRVRRPHGQSVSVSAATDGRKPLIISAGGFVFAQPPSDTMGGSLSTGITYRPTQALELGLSPSHEYFDDGWMWVDDADDRHVFGQLVTNTTKLTLRANVTLSPNVSVEAWAAPLVGSGRFDRFMALADRENRDFSRVFSDVPTVSRSGGTVTLDENGDGVGDFDVRDGDFRVASHRNTLVFRWEWRPGSTLFAVWQHRRDHVSPEGVYKLGRALADLYGGQASQEHVLMLKATWWLGR